jgi:hypothetical protein
MYYHVGARPYGALFSEKFKNNILKIEKLYKKPRDR